jgi:Ca-activated chloride channel family protein
MDHEDHESHEICEFFKGFATFVIVVSFVVWPGMLPAGQTFRARVDTVQVAVTVTDASGRLITGLTKDDFEIVEEGVPQPITVFTNERVPVSLGVLLDASDSMRGQSMVDARTAVDRFVTGLLEIGDEAFVAAFNHQPRLVAPWTRPPSALQGELERVLPSGGTALYDALVASAGYFGRRVHARAALVVVSDGVDTASDWTLHQAREVLQRTDPLVYAIAIAGSPPRTPARRGAGAADAPASRRVNVEALREITATSGGYTEVIEGSADLGPATERIANELNKQYTLGYVPVKPPDGRWRGIRVSVRSDGSRGLTAPRYYTRARRGYYAVR